MTITKIVLDNVCQTGRKTIEPSSAVNVVEGRNGCGKSSLLKGIRAGLTIAPRGSDFTGLLAEGEANGSITLTLDRGIKILRSLSPVGSPLAVESKALGKLENAAASRYVVNTFDAASISCEAFLTKDPKERARLILEAIPFDMDKKALSDIAEEDCAHYDGHPLEIIDVVRKKVYDNRTEINRSAKERRSMAEGLSKTIQSEVDLKAINSEIEAWEADLATLEQERSEKIESATIRQTAANSTAAGICHENTKRLREECQAKIDILKEDLARELAGEDRVFREITDSTEEMVESVRSEADAIFSDKSTAIKLSIQSARQTRDGEVAAAAQRKIMTDGIQSAALLEEQSKALSNKLDAIDEFKGNLLKELPIPGISMEDGQIFIDGKPEDQVPDSRRVKLAIDLGIARSHESSILLLDKAEAIDDEAFENMILPHLQRSGRQCFIARATVNTPDGELRIRKLEGL